MRHHERIVNGYKITFVVLPFTVFQVGRFKFTVVKHATGYLQVRRSKKRLAIFITKKELLSCKCDYTLLHEYLEGMLLLRLISPMERNRLFEKAIEALGNDIPYWEQKAKLAVESGVNPEHIFALIVELAFAKLNMPPDKYKKHLAKALNNRL
jgi:hypothetical protein